MNTTIRSSPLSSHLPPNPIRELLTMTSRFSFPSSLDMAMSNFSIKDASITHHYLVLGTIFILSLVFVPLVMMTMSSTTTYRKSKWGRTEISDMGHDQEKPLLLDSKNLSNTTTTTTSNKNAFNNSYIPNPSGNDSATPPGSRSSSVEDAPRVFGSWDPISFKYPSIPSWLSFDVDKTKPIPFRPFRWGKYFINMGIRPMPWDEWISLDNDYKKTHAIRTHRTLTQGSGRAFETRPGYFPQALEVLLEISSYLSIRYPHCFVVKRYEVIEGVEHTYGDSLVGSGCAAPNDDDEDEEKEPSSKNSALLLTQNGTDQYIKVETEAERKTREGGSGAVKWIKNLITGEEFDFEAIAAASKVLKKTDETTTKSHEEKDVNPIELTHSSKSEPNWDPMRIAGLLVQDDLAVMCEGEDGQYYFQAGSICTAGFWRLQDKIGCTLEEIHSSGNVPGWRDKLKFSMERFFQKLKVDKPVQRNNYFFQIDDNLAWSTQTNGPEEIFDQGSKAPHPDLLNQSKDPSWVHPKPTNDPEQVWFRTERQTLRRMPKTGCILFTIRTYFHKVAHIASEKGVPGRMASAIRSWPEHVATYKGSELYTPILLPYLDALHQEQLDQGVVEMDPETGEVKDLESYPF